MPYLHIGQTSTTHHGGLLYRTLNKGLVDGYGRLYSGPRLGLEAIQSCFAAATLLTIACSAAGNVGFQLGQYECSFCCACLASNIDYTVVRRAH